MTEMSNMTREQVDHEPSGWAETGQPKLCATQNIAPCPALTVWRVQRRGRGYIATGYYCDVHLPIGSAGRVATVFTPPTVVTE